MNGRRWLVTVVAVLAIGSGVTAAIALRPPAAPPVTPVLSPIATVERADLAETHTVDGVIGYGTPTPLPALLPGTITALPAAGAILGRGQRLYAVDNRPVLLLLGTLPAYRDLEPGDRGRDVRQLETNLRRLGYQGFQVDRHYTEATADAVRAWQDDHDLDCTGVVELGRVLFWPTALRVDTVEVTPGQVITAGTTVLTHTPTDRIVTADLDVAMAGLVRVGATVPVSLPGRSPVTGRIKAIGTTIEGAVAEAGAGADPPAEPTVAFTVMIADQKALGRITGAPVQLRLTGERRDNVLTVPVAALLALREGGHGVEVIDGADRDVVPVRTGMFAAGQVEISGDGITEGTRVGTAAS